MDRKKQLLDLYCKVTNMRQYIRFHLNYHNIKYYAKKNIEMKNKHYGEKCFILGNGPSLKEMNLTKIKDETIFAVNFFAKSYLFPQIYPAYYCIIDGAFGRKEYIDDFMYIIKSIDTNLLVEYWAIETLKALKEFDLTNKKIHYSYSLLTQYGESTCYDFTKLVTASVNVICHCIKWALFMGFREIYLLGCDFNQFTRPVQGHFYNSKPAHESSGYVRGLDLMYSSQALFEHYALEKESRKIKSRIFNATPGSLIDAYETVDYNSILR